MPRPPPRPVVQWLPFQAQPWPAQVKTIRPDREPAHCRDAPANADSPSVEPVAAGGRVPSGRVSKNSSCAKATDGKVKLSSRGAHPTRGGNRVFKAPGREQHPAAQWQINVAHPLSKVAQTRECSLWPVCRKPGLYYDARRRPEAPLRVSKLSTRSEE